MSWGGLKKGSPTLSGLVSDLHLASEPRRSPGQGRQQRDSSRERGRVVGVEAAGLYSDEEDDVALDTEDEEEL